MSVNYEPLRNEPASDAGQSVESSMFASVPAWERSKKPRKSFGTSRTTTTTTGAAKTAGANRPNTATLALGAGVNASATLPAAPIPYSQSNPDAASDPTTSATAPTTVNPLPTEASTPVTSPEAPADPPAPTVP